MALSRNGEIFYKEILPKITYDDIEKKYRLNLTAYIPSNLNKKQLGILERICIRNNIILEKLPEKISVQKTEELFKRLKVLKEEIDKFETSEVIKQKQNEYYEIRTKIFEGHQQLVYKIIMDNYSDLESSPFKEDIIQASYEYLLRAIDNYDLKKSNNQTFRWYLHFYASKNILRIMTYIKNNGLNKDLIDIINIREDEEIRGNNPTINDLSSQTGLTKERVEELLTLEQILNAESVEELIEAEAFASDQSFDIEEIINRKLLQELLILLVETLPNEQQKEVIKLYCGLDKSDSYRIYEIAEILDLSRQRVDQHRNKAIELLSHPTRLKYIKELFEGYAQLELPKELSEQILIDETELIYEKLEKYLFKLIYEEELITMIKSLEPKYHQTLLAHFNLTNDSYSSFTDKVGPIRISPGTYIKRKKEGLFQLRELFKEKYIDNNQNKDIKTVLDYLMHNYLNKQRNKIKSRKKDGTH